MFRATTLDMENVPKNPDGSVDYSQDFFGQSTHLTVSGQLDVEPFAQAFRNVYTFGPTFRAENSNTTRHAAEFWMIEPEISFADLEDDMELAEAMLKYIFRYVLENAPEEMNFFNSFVDKGLLERLNHVMTSDFGRVTYTDAVKMLEEHNDQFSYKVYWGCDLQTEHERYLTEQIFKRPVFVTDYPREIKAFYMKLNPDKKTVAAMDCLVPGMARLSAALSVRRTMTSSRRGLRNLGWMRANTRIISTSGSTGRPGMPVSASVLSGWSCT